MTTEIECPRCSTKLAVKLDYLSPTEVAQGAGQKADQAVVHTFDRAPFQRAAAAYVNKMVSLGRWSDQWSRVCRRHLEAFFESDFQLTREGVGQWVDHLNSLEAYTPSNVNAYLTTLAGFCRHEVAYGRMQENPCTGLALRVGTASEGKRRRDEQRLAFTREEVSNVLSALKGQMHDALNRGDTVPGHVLLPLIMAYTGMRNEEVCQLRHRDYRSHTEGTGYHIVPVFDLTAEDAGQRRKTAASRRLVPVHPVLTYLLNRTRPQTPQNGSCWSDRNLLGLRANPGERLSKTPSRWFNELFLKRLKNEGRVRDDSRLSLYSFRHSVATELKHKGHPEPLIAQLLGHSNPNITTGRYGKAYPVEQLAKMLREGIDW